jgi:hypothetical protein
MASDAVLRMTGTAIASDAVLRMTVVRGRRSRQ